MSQEVLPPIQGRPVLRMRWERLLFLHWGFDAEAIQRTLPKGLQVDIFEGRGWLGIVPFLMRRVHPCGLLPMPWISNFHELNVRTYVRSPSGLPGVWFYSLACDQPLAVLLARSLFGLNYVHARMTADCKPDHTHYTCARSQHSTATFEYAMPRDPAPAQPGSLEEFLVERYLLFSQPSPHRLCVGRVHHAPYQISPASPEQWTFLPAICDGFADPARPPDHAMTALPVDVSAWPIHAISEQSGAKPGSNELVVGAKRVGNRPAA